MLLITHARRCCPGCRPETLRLRQVQALEELNVNLPSSQSLESSKGEESHEKQDKTKTTRAGSEPNSKSKAPKARRIAANRSAGSPF